MHYRGIALVTLAVVVSACSSPAAPSAENSGSAQSACAAMMVSMPTDTYSPGSALDVTVDNVVIDCLDQGETVTTAGPEDLDLIFVQGDHSTVLASFSEADGPTVTVTTTIPADAAPGEASIDVRNGESAAITIVP